MEERDERLSIRIKLLRELTGKDPVSIFVTEEEAEELKKDFGIVGTYEGVELELVKEGCAK